MSALPSKTGKRGSVVPLDLARRRLRPARAHSGRVRAGNSDPVLVVALLIALVAAVTGIWMGLVYASHGDYDSAFLGPLWIMIPGVTPLTACYLSGRGLRRESEEPPPAMPLRQSRHRLRRLRPRQ